MSDSTYSSKLRTYPMTYRIIIMLDDDELLGVPRAEVIALAVDETTADRIVNALNASRYPGEAFVYEKMPTEGQPHDRPVQPQ